MKDEFLKKNPNPFNELISLNMNAEVFMKLKPEVVDQVNDAIRKEGDILIQNYPHLKDKINTESIFWKIDENGYVKVLLHEAFHRLGPYSITGSDLFEDSAEIIFPNNGLVKFNYDKDQRIINFCHNDVAVSSTDGSILGSNPRNHEFYSKVINESINVIFNSRGGKLNRSVENNHEPLYFTRFDNLKINGEYEFINGGEFECIGYINNGQMKAHYKYHSLEFLVDDIIKMDDIGLMKFNNKYDRLVFALARIYSMASYQFMIGGIDRLSHHANPGEFISIYSYHPETEVLRIVLNDRATAKLKGALNGKSANLS